MTFEFFSGVPGVEVNPELSSRRNIWEQEQVNCF